MSYICTNCGYLGNPKGKVKGSFLIELVLWLFFILPGVIYSLWRLTNKVTLCPSCGQPTMIPIDTPRGQKLLKEFHKVKPQVKPTEPEKEPEIEPSQPKQWYQTPFWFIVFLVSFLLIFWKVLSVLTG